MYNGEEKIVFGDLIELLIDKKVGIGIIFIDYIEIELDIDVCINFGFIGGLLVGLMFILEIYE